MSGWEEGQTNMTQPIGFREPHKVTVGKKSEILDEMYVGLP